MSDLMLPCNIRVSKELLADAVAILPKLGAEIAAVSRPWPEVYLIKFWHGEVGGDLSLQFSRGGASFLAKLVPAQGMETGTATTEGCGPKDDSPVGTMRPNDPTQGIQP